MWHASTVPPCQQGTLLENEIVQTKDLTKRTMITLAMITSSVGIAVGAVALFNSYILAVVFNRSTALRNQVDCLDLTLI